MEQYKYIAEINLALLGMSLLITAVLIICKYGFFQAGNELETKYLKSALWTKVCSDVALGLAFVLPDMEDVVWLGSILGCVAYLLDFLFAVLVIFYMIYCVEDQTKVTGRKILILLTGGVTLINTVLAVCSVWTGWLYRIVDGQYVRGSLYGICIFLNAVITLLLCILCIRYKSKIWVGDFFTGMSCGFFSLFATVLDGHQGVYFLGAAQTICLLMLYILPHFQQIQGLRERVAQQKMEMKLAVKRREQEEKEKYLEQLEQANEELKIISALSKDYASIYYVDYINDTYVVQRMTGRLREEVAAMAKKSNKYSAAMHQYVEMFVYEGDKKDVEKQLAKENVLKRLREGAEFTIRYQVKPNPQGQDFFEMHFVDVSESENECRVVVGFRCVDEIAHKEIAYRRKIEQAMHDGLTDVKNRLAYQQAELNINKAISDGNSDYGVVVFDVNGLKFVNDHFGHEAGDMLLKDVCQGICEVFVHSPIYRIGGDEFVAVVRNASSVKIETYFTELEERLRRKNAEGVRKYQISVAWGYAAFCMDSVKEWSDLFNLADERMYRRKEELKKLPENAWMIR